MQDADQATPTTSQAPSQSPPSETGTLQRPDSETAKPAPAASQFASFLLVGGLALLIFILLRRIYRRPRAASPHEGLTSRERIEAVRASAAAVSEGHSPGREGLDRCMSDAEELTRRLAATLDNKAARLELLIDDAENAIRRLEEAAQSHGAPEPRASVGVGDGPRLSGRSRLDPSVLDRARLDQLTRERNGGESEPASAETSRPDAGGAREPGADVTRRVYELADAGDSPVEIARKTEQPVGQVELMLNLRRQTG